jgi:hypothetical protein
VPDAKKMAECGLDMLPKGLSPQSMVKMNITYMKDGKLSGSVEYPDSGCEGTLTFKTWRMIQLFSGRKLPIAIGVLTTVKLAYR